MTNNLEQCERDAAKTLNSHAWYPHNMDGSLDCWAPHRKHVFRHICSDPWTKKWFYELLEAAQRHSMYAYARKLADPEYQSPPSTRDGSDSEFEFDPEELAAEVRAFKQRDAAREADELEQWKERKWGLVRYGPGSDLAHQLFDS